MSRNPFTIAVLVAMSALVLVAAGCGSKKASPPATTAATTTAAIAATTAATDTMATTTPAVTTTASGGTPSKDCQQFASAASSVGQEFSQALSGTGNVDLAKASQAFDQLTATAPSAIKGDFQTIDGAFQKMASALKGVDLTSGKTPDAATLAKLSQLSTSINQQALTKASTDISTWVAANCH